MDNDSLQLFTARLRLESAAVAWADDETKLDGLQRAAAAYRNVIRAEQAKIVEVELRDIDDAEEPTKTYRECGFDLSEVG